MSSPSPSRIVLGWTVAVAMMSYGLAQLEVRGSWLLAAAFAVLAMTVGLRSGLRQVRMADHTEVP